MRGDSISHTDIHISKKRKKDAETPPQSDNKKLFQFENKETLLAHIKATEFDQVLQYRAKDAGVSRADYLKHLQDQLKKFPPSDQVPPTYGEPQLSLKRKSEHVVDDNNKTLAMKKVSIDQLAQSSTSVQPRETASNALPDSITAASDSPITLEQLLQQIETDLRTIPEHPLERIDSNGIKILVDWRNDCNKNYEEYNDKITALKNEVRNLKQDATSEDQKNWLSLHYKKLQQHESTLLGNKSEFDTAWTNYDRDYKEDIEATMQNAINQHGHEISQGANPGQTIDNVYQNMVAEITPEFDGQDTYYYNRFEETLTTYGGQLEEIGKEIRKIEADKQQFQTNSSMLSDSELSDSEEES